MKPYDLVICDDPSELIAVTNEAVRFGYKPIGGMVEMQGRYIQTIFNNNLKPKQMNNFFKELSGLLDDKQQAKITIARTGEELTVMITAKGKIVNASGSPEEMDEKLMPALQAEVEAKTFTFNVSDSSKSDKDDDEGEEDTTKKLSGKEKRDAQAKVKKLIIEGDSLLKKKKNVEAVQKFNEAVEVNKTLDVTDKKLADKIAKASEGISPAEPNANPEVKETAATISKKETVQSAEQTINTPAAEDKSEAQNKQRVFNDAMARGAEYFKNKKYEDAQKAYHEALEIFPEDKESINQSNNVAKWLKALAEL